MQIFDILIILAILAVTITLGFGLYSLFRGGDYARSHSNKLMRLRVGLQAVAVILLVVGMVSGVTAAHYTWTSYVSTYAITHEGMSTQGAYWVSVFAQTCGLIALPLWGALSDRIGRKPVMYTFAPCSASAFADARPIPALPPVTNATLSASFLLMVHFLG